MKEGVRFGKQITTMRTYPPAAPGGEPPAKRTGNLSGGIYGKTRIIAGKAVQFDIRSDANRAGRPYPLFLEVGWTTRGGTYAFPRPWLRPIFDHLKEQIQPIIMRPLDSRDWSLVRKPVRKIREGTEFNIQARVEIHI
jgi:hypothetical protein